MFVYAFIIHWEIYKGKPLCATLWQWVGPTVLTGCGVRELLGMRWQGFLPHANALAACLAQRIEITHAHPDGSLAAQVRHL